MGWGRPTPGVLRYLCSGDLMLGVLEVIAGKGGVDRHPGASARAGATQRARRVTAMLSTIRRGVGARLLIGSLSVVSDWCSLGLCDTACLCTEFTIPTSLKEFNP